MLADMPALLDDFLMPIAIVGIPVGLFVFFWLVSIMDTRQKFLSETINWNSGRCNFCNQPWQLTDITEEGKTYSCPCENSPIIITTNADTLTGG